MTSRMFLGRCFFGRASLLGYLLLALLATSSCQRSCGDFWQDTKSAKRHMGRGLATLVGKRVESRQVSSKDEFKGVVEEEYIPFADADLYQGIMRGEELALLQINADTAIPQSRMSPGEACSGLPGIDGFISPRGEQVRIFRPIHFETDDYVVRGEENWEQIRQMAAYLKAHNETYVFIEGHCDERGPAAYNLALGTRRSNAIRNHLIKEGVDLDRLLTVSYGKERPSSLSHDAAAWKENRRAQFKTYSKS